MNCPAVRPFLQAYVDNELSPERAIEVEQHIFDCPTCMCEVELTRQVALATRHSVTESTMCPDFHARLCRCLADERKRQERLVVDPLSWKVVAPLAAAVAMAIVVSYGGSAYHRSQQGATDGGIGYQPWGPVSAASSAQSGQENLVDFLVRTHSKRFRPDVVRPDEVGALETELGFAVRPPDLGRYGARFEGAHLVPINHRTRAAVLRYSLGGRRVTLYVYNPDELPLIRQRNLQLRVIGDRAVFVGTSHGYSIATCERHGVGYAVTADLSNDESAELVAALDH